MGEKKFDETKPKSRRAYLTYDELREEFVDWSNDTIKSRIEKDGFPAIKDGNSYLFPRAEIPAWFTKRKVQG